MGTKDVVFDRNGKLGMYCTLLTAWERIIYTVCKRDTRQTPTIRFQIMNVFLYTITAWGKTRFIDFRRWKFAHFQSIKAPVLVNHRSIEQRSYKHSEIARKYLKRSVLFKNSACQRQDWQLPESAYKEYNNACHLSFDVISSLRNSWLTRAFFVKPRFWSLLLRVTLRFIRGNTY